ncbi:MAG: recombinase family protein [Lachnospiraceae bacterium]|nr:recombinase family protein [Lachnospiraceae bacterium]
MARTSKKKQTNENLTVNARPSKIYSVGIYARLSVDANDRKNESIETQIEIAKAFISRQSDLGLFDCYTDIGKTGTNFEREGFERMMRDVRMRRIDCIVVKDLSRFGRNHIETGNYIEKIFPFMGVRFIAVTDNFDSMNISGQNETLRVNLKNLVNEMYAKDIAVKVKSSRQAKWEQGSYTGGVAPYGYKAEWIGDKKCLFVEDAAADIVKKIFDLFLSGKNMKEIVIWLYGEKIVRPTEYHKTGHVYCQDGEKLQQWSRGTVKMILTNPVYRGCLVQGRTCGKDYMMRDRHDIDSEDWSVKEHTHEAIINEELFFKAAGKFEKSSIYCNKNGYSKKIPIDEDIYADVLYCGDCGFKMKRISAIKTFGSKDSIRTYSYNCPKTDRIDDDRCTAKSITLNSLNNLVREAIRQEFSLSAMRPKDLAESNNKEAEQLKADWNEELLELERKIENLTKRTSEQYLKYRMGEMDAESFKRMKEENDKKITSFQKKRADVAEKLTTIDYETVQKNHFLRTLVKGNEKGELTAEVVGTLIHRIEIYPDHRVKVIFTFKRNDVLLERI